MSIFKNRTPLDPGLSLILRFFDLVMLGLWVVGLLFYAIAAETFLRGLRVYVPYRIFIYLCFRMSMRESPSPRDTDLGAEEKRAPVGDAGSQIEGSADHEPA